MFKSKKEILEDEFVQNDTIALQQKLEENEVILLQNKVTDVNIKTVLCHVLQDALSLLLNLKSDEKLLISFDDLDLMLMLKTTIIPSFIVMLIGLQVI